MDSSQKAQLHSLVREVGRGLLNYWPARTTRPLQSRLKENDTPVTEADEYAHKAIVSGIGDIFTGDFVASEEESDLRKPESSEQAIWFVDPLDGTRTFITGGSDFSILLGRAQNGLVDYGIMYFPALGLFAEAETGCGATVNGVRIAVSNCSLLDEAKSFSRPRGLGHLSGNTHENYVTGRALLGVARGEFDLGVFKLNSFGPHDFAAASIMIGEAGGVLLDERGRTDFFSIGHIPKYLVTGSKILVDKILPELS
jgi:fructose-1,6-bisphosphatase/inositol monophosphatase family enzyme